MDKAPTRTELAWAAGLFDGEGSLTLYRNKSPIFELAMTYQGAVVRFSQVLGLRPPIKRRPHGPLSRKVSWRTRVESWGETERVLRLMLPYLVAKQQEALVVLDLTEWHRQRKAGSIYSVQDSCRHDRAREALRAARQCG